MITTGASSYKSPLSGHYDSNRKSLREKAFPKTVPLLRKGQREGGDKCWVSSADIPPPTLEHLVKQKEGTYCTGAENSPVQPEDQPRLSVRKCIYACTYFGFFKLFNKNDSCLDELLPHCIST
jgi:hypothetical protein